MATRVRPTAATTANRAPIVGAAQQVDENLATTTYTSSLTHISQLLRTGISCVTFLRGIFEDELSLLFGLGSQDNFVNAAIRTPSVPVSDTNPAATSKALEEKKSQPSTVKVKSLIRGASREADLLLDYLDSVDAAFKLGYVERLVLAIFHDPEEPDNIVEAYTFSFDYEADADGKQRIAMTLPDQWTGTGKGGQSSSLSEGDVKRQIQKLIKNLLMSTQALDELPRRRYIDMRLYFTENAPDDYEPALFQPIPPDEGQLRITTPRLEDRPDVAELGDISTGFHNLSCHYISIAHLLNTVFDDKITHEEALARNRRDAQSRNVEWDGESLALSITSADSNLKPMDPVGVRDNDGNILTVEEICARQDPQTKQLRLKVGLEGTGATVIRTEDHFEPSIQDSNISDSAALQKELNIIMLKIDRIKNRGGDTQLLEITQPQPNHPPALIEELHGFQDLQMSFSQDDDFYRSNVRQDALQAGFPLPSEQAPRIVVAFENGTNSAHQNVPARGRTSQTSSALAEMMNRCDCGMPWIYGSIDLSIFILKALSAAPVLCQISKHFSCYGFATRPHAAVLRNLICYACRTADVTGLRSHEFMLNFHELAKFRRAIEVLWNDGVPLVSELAARLGTDRQDAAAIIQRLRCENFIVEEKPQPKEEPVAKGRGRGRGRPRGRGAPRGGGATRGRGAASNGSGSTQKVDVVNRSPEQSRYKKVKYFTPGQGAELPILELLSREAKLVVVNQRRAPENEIRPPPHNGHASPASTDSIIQTQPQSAAQTVNSQVANAPDLAQASASTIVPDTPETSQVLPKPSRTGQFADEIQSSEMEITDSLGFAPSTFEETSAFPKRAAPIAQEALSEKAKGKRKAEEEVPQGGENYGTLKLPLQRKVKRSRAIEALEV
ncbi:BQ5605_C003g02397 [Microbotryum silenes-dioicae]|uniref:BQ5605_C003g02397 protein n=1 Tax=Microbotryum silenes-dioicae TaxID=796604 RepID=A0A2X0MNP8_9BASI|nr:BQ5605_C003g02397 [Microbotryum silenes-dioicae]